MRKLKGFLIRHIFFVHLICTFSFCFLQLKLPPIPRMDLDLWPANYCLRANYVMVESHMHRKMLSFQVLTFWDSLMIKSKDIWISHIDEIQLKIVSGRPGNSLLVFVGNQGIEMGNNDLLLFKTRVIKGLVSFREDA